MKAYGAVVTRQLVDRIYFLGEALNGASIQHINSTRLGGGVAEILSWLVPYMREIGLDASWEVLQGDEEFFNITKNFHNALQGGRIEIKPKMLNKYQAVAEANYDLIKPGADYVVIHDQQPLGLTELRKGHRGKWVWRCHVDLSEADIQVWGFLRHLIERCDAAIFHMAEFLKELFIDEYIVPPAIDPLNDKNRSLSDAEVQEVLSRFKIDPERPIILQVSRFDRFKDPLGVIKSYRMVRKWYDCQLVLAGGTATDDPEGLKVLQEIEEFRGDDPNCIILNLKPTSHLEINALQRAATVVMQKSLKEGFGLTVTEAMWKGKPVIGGAVGGIRRQVIHGQTGYLVQTIEGGAFRLRQLLGNPGLAARLGAAGRRMVSENFLLPHYLLNWLQVLHAVKRPKQRIISFYGSDWKRRNDRDKQ